MDFKYDDKSFNEYLGNSRINGVNGRNSMVFGAEKVERIKDAKELLRERRIARGLEKLSGLVPCKKEVNMMKHSDKWVANEMFCFILIRVFNSLKNR